MEIPAQLAEDAVDRGSILITRFRGIDHPKFFVVIGISDDAIAGFFYINSEINTNVNRKPEQLQMQYKIMCADYNFLSYDSYICATEIVKLPKSDIAKGIREKRVSIKDTLKQQHIDELLSLVRNSKLFSEKDKRQFLY